MNVADDLYLGGFLTSDGILPKMTSDADPTINQGVGPMGRIAFLNIVPKTIETNNLAVAQHFVANVPLVLTAGLGITLGTAPDGSQATVYVLDCNRCVSLTSVGNLSADTFLVAGYDFYGRKTTQLVTAGSTATVNTLKAFASLLSVVPTVTDAANTIAVGTADIFGLPYVTADAGYIVCAKWNNTLAQNAGTLTIADATTPATNLTGDPRGTYSQAGSASNGSRRLVIGMHLIANQCGPNATPPNVLGVTPV